MVILELYPVFLALAELGPLEVCRSRHPFRRTRTVYFHFRKCFRALQETFKFLGQLTKELPQARLLMTSHAFTGMWRAGALIDHEPWPNCPSEFSFGTPV